MISTIRLVPLADSDSAALLGASSNWAGARPLAAVTLRFGLEASQPEILEAILHARRSMLREEWTRGRDEGEPLLAEALFSPAEIVWEIRPEQKRWCLQKVQELQARADRWLSEQQRAISR
ncbi:MAG TPA: hypothetical protein VEG84_00915 [Thermoanaerobaculia bacterium]|nr:hypothetical protein [Thermoanaerobaculia bacterium]